MRLLLLIDRCVRVEPGALLLYGAAEVVGAVADVTAGWAERYAASARWLACVSRCVP